MYIYRFYVYIYSMQMQKKIQKKSNWWRDNDNLKFVHARDALFEAQNPSALPRVWNEWLQSDTQKKIKKEENNSWNYLVKLRLD